MLLDNYLFAIPDVDTIPGWLCDANTTQRVPFFGSIIFMDGFNTGNLLADAIHLRTDRLGQCAIKFYVG